MCGRPPIYSARGLLLIAAIGLVAGPPYLVYKGSQKVWGAGAQQLGCLKQTVTNVRFSKGQRRFEELLLQEDPVALRLQSMLYNLTVHLGLEPECNIDTLMRFQYRFQFPDDELLLSAACHAVKRYANLAAGKRGKLTSVPFYPQIPLETLTVEPATATYLDTLPEELRQLILSHTDGSDQYHVQLLHIHLGDKLLTQEGRAALTQLFSTLYPYPLFQKQQ